MGHLGTSAEKLDFSWLDETQTKLDSHDVSSPKRAHLQKKKKKSFGKKLAKAFVSSAVGKFKTSFAKIGGKIGKFVQKASDFLSSNDNVIGRLLNKVRALKNVVVQKAFKVLDKAESFANKFISRFPAPIRLKLEEAMHKPLNDIRGKISQADSRLDKFLNPIETQYEKLKDKYVPDYARELMQLDNIPSEDLSSGDLTGVSQEYLDQAKGTIEAELDQKATAHVNDNIQTIDNELADAEKKLNKVGEDLNGVGEGCKSRDGRRGECKINSGDVERDCGENMEFITGRCPGPRKVQCCIPEPLTPAVSGVGEGCKSRDGRRGECKINSGDVDRDCGEDGEFITGRCPGPTMSNAAYGNHGYTCCKWGW